jgi:hypothetical protein
MAEQSAHPHEFAELSEFKEVTDAFLRPDVTLDILYRYACGANWPLSCAALLTLSRHPERNLLSQAIIGQLVNIRPWAIYFALKYFCTLDPQPAVGAPIMVAPDWWPQNLVIPDLFGEYLAAREALGDEPSFGGQLDSSTRAPPEQILALLEKIKHPFASQLLTELRQWLDLRLDRQFLSSFGRFWSSAADPLLLEPEAWRAAREQAESAALRHPRRSIVVIGDPRVGKSSFLRVFGQRLERAGWTVFEATGNELQAGKKYIGELEGRIRRLVEELDVRKRVAWYCGRPPAARNQWHPQRAIRQHPRPGPPRGRGGTPRHSIRGRRLHRDASLSATPFAPLADRGLPARTDERGANQGARRRGRSPHRGAIAHSCQPRCCGRIR